MASKSVETLLKWLRSTCAPVAWAKAARFSVLGKAAQSAKDAGLTVPLKVEEGHCYRVLVATSGETKAVSVVVRDGKGAIAAHHPGPEPPPALPEGGSLCFDTSDMATVAASLGDGEGQVAIAVLSSP